jgi:hypothetical protein
VTASTVEKLLNGSFSGQPKLSRFPLPEMPATVAPSATYTHSNIVVTSQIARDWILNRTVRRELIPAADLHADVIPNRKYLVAYGKSIAKKLQEPGWWNEGIHQGLAFTPDGFILDGQHRLLGCALSGIPIVLPLAVNVPWSAFRDIDQNRSRAAHQMIDLPYATTATATARHLLPFLRDEWQTVYTYSGKQHDSDVIDICLGWPYFAEDQQWMKEVYEAAKECGLSGGSLGAVIIGSLASGIDPDEVQQFLNGLRPLTRKVNYETIGTSGSDPRQLIARFFRSKSLHNGGKRRISVDEERAHAGTLRHAMNVWLARNSKTPIKITKLQSWSPAHDLPPIGDPEKIREFHDKHVN